MSSKKGKSKGNKPSGEKLNKKDIETEEVTEETKAPEETEEQKEEAKAEEPKEEAKTENAEAEETKEEAKKEEPKKDKKDEKIEELEDKVKRQLAEFDNFRKRTEKEKTESFDAGARSVLEKILPVVDNFERGLATIAQEKDASSHAEGMNMIYKQLVTELEKMDVKPIEALGKEFDPNFHNAIMQEASEEYESGVVCKELLKGYTYKETVIRHSMVAVAE
ncbi:MAG: nucleotide exchange factor GrpE [Lachnospiraceae bacterium]|nr:nucleotide exchange factor GrpE [Lachnospiraceae bacterium]